MAKDFIPTTDMGKRSWGLNFKTLTTATPLAYSLTAPQAAAFAALFDAYDAALTTATEASTRTTPAIVLKDQTRDAMVENARELVRIIQASPNVTDEQRGDLQITIRDEEPTPVPVPDIAPTVDFVQVVGRTVRIKLHAPEGEGRGLPPGVAGITILSCVSAELPTSASNWRWEGNTTKSMVDIAFSDTVPAGSQVWIAASYYNGKGENGINCTPVSTHLQGGASAEAA